MGKYTVLVKKSEWSLDGSFDDCTKKEFNSFEEAQKYLKEDFFSSLESCKKYIESSFSGSGHEYKEPEYKDKEEEGYVVHYQGKNNHAYISEYYLDEDLDDASLVCHSCNENFSLNWSIICTEADIDEALYCKKCENLLEEIYAKQICDRTLFYYLDKDCDNLQYSFDEDEFEITEKLGYYCSKCDTKIDKEQKTILFDKFKL